MRDDDADEGLEARLRLLAQQLARSVEHLEELDLETLARDAGIDVDRAREFLDGAGEWFTTQADNLVNEVTLKLGGFAEAMGRGLTAPSGAGPHPLDLPTPGQGLALSAIDSGRWKVEPGSHVILATGEGPAPTDALGLVGELRARDWIDADGEVTLVGRSALARWVERSV